jgi:hypothetical protein
MPPRIAHPSEPSPVGSHSSAPRGPPAAATHAHPRRLPIAAPVRRAQGVRWNGGWPTEVCDPAGMGGQATRCPLAARHPRASWAAVAAPRANAGCRQATDSRAPRLELCHRGGGCPPGCAPRRRLLRACPRIRHTHAGHPPLVGTPERRAGSGATGERWLSAGDRSRAPRASNCATEGWMLPRGVHPGAACSGHAPLIRRTRAGASTPRRHTRAPSATAGSSATSASSGSGPRATSASHSARPPLPTTTRSSWSGGPRTAGSEFDRQDASGVGGWPTEVGGWPPIPGVRSPGSDRGHGRPESKDGRPSPEFDRRHHGRTLIVGRRPTSGAPAAPELCHRGVDAPRGCTSAPLAPGMPRIRHTRAGHPPLMYRMSRNDASSRQPSSRWVQVAMQHGPGAHGAGDEAVRSLAERPEHGLLGSRVATGRTRAGRWQSRASLPERAGTGRRPGGVQGYAAGNGVRSAAAQRRAVAPAPTAPSKGAVIGLWSRSRPVSETWSSTGGTARATRNALISARATTSKHETTEMASGGRDACATVGAPHVADVGRGGQVGQVGHHELSWRWWDGRTPRVPLAYTSDRAGGPRAPQRRAAPTVQVGAAERAHPTAALVGLARHVEVRVLRIEQHPARREEPVSDRKYRFARAAAHCRPPVRGGRRRSRRSWPTRRPPGAGSSPARRRAWGAITRRRGP